MASEVSTPGTVSATVMLVGNDSKKFMTNDFPRHVEVEESREKGKGEGDEFFDNDLSTPPSYMDYNYEEEDSTFDDLLSEFSRGAGGSRRSSIVSIARSIDSIYRNYHFENDRRYLHVRGGQYLMPNDDIEQDRIDIYHQMIFTLLGGELYLSPIGNPLRILDIGTGTGVWAIEMASKFPSSRVIGTDLSPIQADPSPSNCEFRIEDAEQDWLYPTNYFDFIHTRQMIGKIENWPAYFARAFKHTRPGGWVESEESDGIIQKDELLESESSSQDQPAISKLLDLHCKGMEIVGNPYGEVVDFERYMTQAGFVDVQVNSYRLPVGTWPAEPLQKLVGRYNILNLLEGLEGHCLPVLTKVLNMDMAEAKELIAEAEMDVQNRSRQQRLYFTYFNSRGRKPL